MLLFILFASVGCNSVQSRKMCFWKACVAHYSILLASSQCTYPGNTAHSLRCSLQIQNISNGVWPEKNSIKHCYFLVICSAGSERFRGRVSTSLSSSAGKATLFTSLVHFSEDDRNIDFMFFSKASFRFSKGIFHFNRSTSAVHNLLDNLCLAVVEHVIGTGGRR